jgi:hypothetical protein
MFREPFKLKSGTNCQQHSKLKKYADTSHIQEMHLHTCMQAHDILTIKGIDCERTPQETELPIALLGI